MNSILTLAFLRAGTHPRRARDQHRARDGVMLATAMMTMTMIMRRVLLLMTTKSMSRSKSSTEYCTSAAVARAMRCRTVSRVPAHCRECSPLTRQAFASSAKAFVRARGLTGHPQSVYEMMVGRLRSAQEASSVAFGVLLASSFAFARRRHTPRHTHGAMQHTLLV